MNCSCDTYNLTGSLDVNTSICACPCYTSYSTASMYIMGFAAIPVFVFGIISNVISVLVFTHKAMRNSLINWYLTARSLADFLLLLTSFFLFCLPRMGDWFQDFRAINFSYITTPVTYGLAMTAQTASIYLTVLMTAHRFTGVCFPFNAANILSRGRVKIALAVFLSFSVIFNVTRFMEVTIIDFCEAPNLNRYIYQLFPTTLRMDPTYTTILFGWTYTILMFLVPFSALIIMNSKVIHAVHATRKRHESIHRPSDASKSLEARKERSTSIMLVAVVLVFLACNTLTLVLNVLEVSQLSNPGDSVFSIMVDISNLLVAVSCATNIFVYCSFSEKYRILLKYYLCCHWMREGEMLLSSLEFT